MSRRFYVLVTDLLFNVWGFFRDPGSPEHLQELAAGADSSDSLGEVHLHIYPPQFEKMPELGQID